MFSHGYRHGSHLNPQFNHWNRNYLDPMDLEPDYDMDDDVVINDINENGNAVNLPNNFTTPYNRDSPTIDTKDWSGPQIDAQNSVGIFLQPPSISENSDIQTIEEGENNRHTNKENQEEKERHVSIDVDIDEDVEQFIRQRKISQQGSKHKNSKRSTRRRSRNGSVTSGFLTNDELSDKHICSQGDNVKKIYDDTSEASEEQIFENIKLQKDIIASIRTQPWRMKQKLKTLSLAQVYIHKHEGNLSRTHGYQEAGHKVWVRFKRAFNNVVITLTPWEMKFKKIESHFGSVVSSYFVFIRWLVWMNILLAILTFGFVVIPELLVGDESSLGKQIPKVELVGSEDLTTLWDFGGIFKYSMMFYGWYGSTKFIGNGYRAPLAYLLAGLSTYIISFVLLLRKMASNAKQNKQSSKEEHYNFCWKMYTSWDFTIGAQETAKNKFAEISTVFKETVLEEEERSKTTNKKLLLFLRIIANIIVMCILAGSTYIIYYVVQRSREFEKKTKDGSSTLSWWEVNEYPEEALSVLVIHGKEDTKYLPCVLNGRNEGTLPISRTLLNTRSTRKPDSWREMQVSIVMSLITTLFPSLFDLVGMMEKYHPRVNLRWQLARIFVLYLLNLYTLYIALFYKIDDLQKQIEKNLNHTSANGTILAASLVQLCPLPVDGTTNGTDAAVIQTSGVLSNITATSLTTTIALDVNSTTPTVRNCSAAGVQALNADHEYVCWETMVGQEIVKLTNFDMLFTVAAVILIDFLRGLFVRYVNRCCCWDLEKKFPEYGEFKIAENILHLIYNQGMIWLGTFFSPPLPALNILKLVILLYVRSWAVMMCNIPLERVFRVSGSNNFYLFLALVMLFLCTLPTGYAITAIKPSRDCGPFKQEEVMYKLFSRTIDEEFPQVLVDVINYISSPGILIPMFILLIMVIYYFVSLANSLKEANSDLRHQLHHERTEEKKKIYAMADERAKSGDNGHVPGSTMATGSKLSAETKQGQIRELTPQEVLKARQKLQYMAHMQALYLMKQQQQQLETKLRTLESSDLFSSHQSSNSLKPPGSAPISRKVSGVSDASSGMIKRLNINRSASSASDFRNNSTPRLSPTPDIKEEVELRGNDNTNNRQMVPPNVAPKPKIVIEREVNVRPRNGTSKFDEAIERF